MLKLLQGEYTGNVIQHLKMDDSIITNTQYAKANNNTNWHYHENLHICFVFEKGKSETLKRTLYTENEGSIFFYHAEEKHRWISPSPVSKSANIEISTSFLKKYNLTEENIYNSLKKNIHAKALMLKIQHEMTSQKTTNIAAISTLLLELTNYDVNTKNYNTPLWVNNLKELLHTYWNTNLSLEFISQKLNIHPITISKNFRTYFNCTLGEYQRKIKIAKSIHLIKNYKMSLTEIAFYCGFADQSHFSRNFKHYTGFSPRHFKNF